MNLLMIHEAYMPVCKWSRFFLWTDGRTNRSIPWGPRGPKNDWLSEVFRLLFLKIETKIHEERKYQSWLLLILFFHSGLMVHRGVAFWVKRWFRQICGLADSIIHWIKLQFQILCTHIGAGPFDQGLFLLLSYYNLNRVHFWIASLRFWCGAHTQSFN